MSRSRSSSSPFWNVIVGAILVLLIALFVYTLAAARTLEGAELALDLVRIWQEGWLFGPDGSPILPAWLGLAALPALLVTWALGNAIDTAAGRGGTS